MIGRIVLTIAFVLIMLFIIFLLDVLCKIGSRASEMEEQMEIERKLKK
jgi:hypothetical protein